MRRQDHKLLLRILNSEHADEGVQVTAYNLLNIWNYQLTDEEVAVLACEALSPTATGEGNRTHGIR